MKLKQNHRTKEWSASYWADGRKTIRLGTTTHREAKARADELGLERTEFLAKANRKLALKHPSRLGDTPGKIPQMREFLEEWEDHMVKNATPPSTIASRRQAASLFLDYSKLWQAPVHMIGDDAVRDWINAKGKANLTTRKNRLHHLRSMFRYANSKGHVTGNPAELVAVNHRLLDQSQLLTTRKDSITREEYEHALDHVHDPFLRWFLVVGYWTGMRAGDIASLEWRNFSVPSHIEVFTGKTGKAIHLNLDVPQTGSGAVIRECLSIPPSGEQNHLFPFHAMRYSRAQGRVLLSKHFSSAMRSLGIDKTAHCLRRSFARRLEADGIAIEDISIAMGHSNKRTTEGYL
jgi:integrase